MRFSLFSDYRFYAIYTHNPLNSTFTVMLATIDAETFSYKKSDIFLILPEEDKTKYFIAETISGLGFTFDRTYETYISGLFMTNKKTNSIPSVV
jgi:hypothetical protein